MMNLENQTTQKRAIVKKKVPWKQLGQACIVLTILAMSLALVFLAERADTTKTAQTSSPDSCSLQESKPILIISLNGTESSNVCAKTIARSNGRYFTYFGAPPWDYKVMCAVSIKKIQYTVYDVIPLNVTPTTRYSMITVCPLLQQHHRLIGEGF